MFMKSRRNLFVLGLLLVLLMPSLAAAEIGPAMTGLSGNANDATTAFSCPAGITRLKQSQAVLQTAFVYEHSKFDVDEASFGGGDGDGDSSFLVIPGFFYARPLGERWHVGLSVNVPSGIGYDFGSSWAGRYHVTETSLAFVAGSAVAAYQVTDKLSLAAGPYLIYVDSKTKTRVNNLLPDYSDGKVKLEESGADLGYVLSMMYQFTDATRVGATYHSELKPDLDGTPSFHNIDPLLREALAALDLLGTEIDVDFTVPAIAQAGIYTELNDRWSLTGDVIWLDMSEFGITHLKVEQESISVDGTFRDMWITTAGVKYRFDEDRAISLGALYATSPVKDSKRIIALPMDRIVGGGIGLSLPVLDYPSQINLNFFDLGEAKVTADGGLLTGDFNGSFDRNYAVMLDIQITL
jgi:long-chain fatty acid transport protein